MAAGQAHDYLCPWSSYGRDRIFHLFEQTDLAAEDLRRAQTLYLKGLEHYHAGKSDERQQWSHWSVHYIDYFGPRKFIPVGRSFT